MDKYLKVVLSVVIMILISCGSDVSEEKLNEAKGRLFIIGGGSRPDELMDRMLKEAELDENGYMVILPVSSELPDSAIIWASDQFVRLGIDNIAGFNFLPDEKPKAEWIDSLRNASLIYISGGDQNRFMSVVRNTEIEEAIHYAWENGAMVAGTSAGAAVMSEKMITGNELKHTEYRSTFRVVESENIELTRGLGLINTAIIDQHFLWRSRYNRLFSAVIEHPDLVGIGIDESTAVLVYGNEYEVVGASQVLLFKNPDRSFVVKDGKLGARNLTIDIYLPGDKFIIK